MRWPWRPAAARPASPAGVPTRDSSDSSMVRHEAALGNERQPAIDPCPETALHVVGVVSRGPERSRGHCRAGAEPALEDDPVIARDGLRLGGQALERDVPRARDVPGFVLVRLADVDQLGLPAPE